MLTPQFILKISKGILIIFLTLPLTLFAQDSIVRKKIFSISFNVVQAFINENNISIEYKMSEKKSLGLTLGQVRYNGNFDPLFISPSQDKWPGTVYDGYSLRTYLKFFSDNDLGKYWSIQMLYKNLYYHNLSFSDCTNNNCDVQDSYVDFIRSETAYVLGVDFIKGRESALGKLLWKNTHAGQIFYIDIFYGLGLRFRSRDYTTHIIHAPYYYSGIPEGPSHRDQFYPAIDFGIKVGVNVLKPPSR